MISSHISATAMECISLKFLLSFKLRSIRSTYVNAHLHLFTATKIVFFTGIWHHYADVSFGIISMEQIQIVFYAE